MRWEKVDKLVKQVVEAWTHDGSNVKFDRAFRIYTNERQAARYFRSENAEQLSTDDLLGEIQRLKLQIDAINGEIQRNQIQRKKLDETFRTTKKKSDDNRRKIGELTQVETRVFSVKNFDLFFVSHSKEFERLNAAMPNVEDFTREELEEQLRLIKENSRTIEEKFHQAKEKKDAEHSKLADIKENAEHIARKLEAKKASDRRGGGKARRRAEQAAQSSTTNSEINGQIASIQRGHRTMSRAFDRIEEKTSKSTSSSVIEFFLSEKPNFQKSKNNVPMTRPPREIQQELDAIEHFLKSNEDT